MNFYKRDGAAADIFVQLATKNGVQVINMSFTGNYPVAPGQMEETGVDDPLSLFATALSAAADSQIFLVASAGNNHSEFVENQANNLPASHPRVVAAGGQHGFL